MKKRRKKTVLGRVEILSEKEKTNFLPSPLCFQKLYILGLLKSKGYVIKSVTEWLVGWLVVLGFNAT